MTNFEKWKSELTPEGVYRQFRLGDLCFICPAWGNKYDGDDNYYCEGSFDRESCLEFFLEWAVTNFEKWKSELTVESLFKKLRLGDVCFLCPAYEEYDNDDNCYCEGSFDRDGCEEFFIGWANREINE